MYSALTSSFTLPLVQTKYPRAHRCRPQNSVRNRGQSCSSRWLRLATEGNTCAERAREASCRLPERRRHAPPTALAMEPPAFTADELTEVLRALSELAKRDESLVGGLHALI